ncbi:hypothetical protein KEF85_11955 [Methylomonas paludis]|uniref:Uncharacterized protein n=1 Tax=Methylomonas paludis TaxID=1173101 RepID=A0A975MLL9_9GAMM|nr:hypothetical protein [Methylomonas paludis]QWF70062.1 hypothetical protein KEF85_11955 [Methylomonas paludis]
MRTMLICIIFLMVVSRVGRAADNDFSICAVAGFYAANHNQFLTDLAERIAAKNNLFGDERCTLALKAGKDTGGRFSKPNEQRTDSDNLIIRQATHFSNLIYDSILSRVKF